MNFASSDNSPEFSDAAVEGGGLPRAAVGAFGVVPVLGLLVGREDDAAGHEVDGGAFLVNRIRVAINDLKKLRIRAAMAVELVPDDGVLAVVAVPPVGFVFVVSFRTSKLPSLASFTSTRRANDKDELHGPVAARGNQALIRGKPSAISDEITEMLFRDSPHIGALIQKDLNGLQV